MFLGITNSWLYCAYRARTQFVLADGSTVIDRQGTAFFVRREDDQQCLVTNRHVIDIEYGEPSGKYRGSKLVAMSIEGFAAQPGQSDALPTTRNDFFVALHLCTIRYPADYHEDVVCIVRPMLGHVGKDPVRIDFQLEAKELADDKWISDFLTVCDFVAFPGFPPWYDKSEGRPILRTGTISSDPRANYSDTLEPKGRRIAYEAFSFGGSSGSPVIATQKGIPGFASSGPAAAYREGRIVGINAGHMSAPMGAHSGVSYFIKSSAILDLIRNDGFQETPSK